MFNPFASFVHNKLFIKLTQKVDISSNSMTEKMKT